MRVLYWVKTISYLAIWEHCWISYLWVWRTQWVGYLFSAYHFWKETVWLCSWKSFEMSFSWWCCSDSGWYFLDWQDDQGRTWSGHWKVERIFLGWFCCCWWWYLRVADNIWLCYYDFSLWLFRNALGWRLWRYHFWQDKWPARWTVGACPSLFGWGSRWRNLQVSRGHTGRWVWDCCRFIMLTWGWWCFYVVCFWVCLFWIWVGRIIPDLWSSTSSWRRIFSVGVILLWAPRMEIELLSSSGLNCLCWACLGI